jgi:hypothetical protein
METLEHITERLQGMLNRTAGKPDKRATYEQVCGVLVTLDPTDNRFLIPDVLCWPRPYVTRSVDDAAVCLYMQQRPEAEAKGSNDANDHA